MATAGRGTRASGKRRPAKRKPARRSAGARKRSWNLYLIAAVALAAIIGAVWYWWDTQHWTPDEALYPDQGAEIGAGQGLVNFDTVRALGGRFVYLEASEGANGEDARFARNYAAARRAGLKVGALHRFDPCAPADRQSANFVTMVPRDAEMLPPAVALDATAKDCPERVGDAAVESELMTFINQVEMHSGKPVILKPSEKFEDRYHVGETIERNLWLMRDRFEPDYVQRPWLLWSANAALVSEASDEPIEWVVVQP